MPIDLSAYYNSRATQLQQLLQEQLNQLGAFNVSVRHDLGANFIASVMDVFDPMNQGKAVDVSMRDWMAADQRTTPGIYGLDVATPNEAHYAFGPITQLRKGQAPNIIDNPYALMARFLGAAALQGSIHDIIQEGYGVGRQGKKEIFFGLPGAQQLVLKGSPEQQYKQVTEDIAGIWIEPGDYKQQEALFGDFVHQVRMGAIPQLAGFEEYRDEWHNAPAYRGGYGYTRMRRMAVAPEIQEYAGVPSGVTGIYPWPEGAFKNVNVTTSARETAFPLGPDLTPLPAEQISGGVGLEAGILAYRGPGYVQSESIRTGARNPEQLFAGLGIVGNLGIPGGGLAASASVPSNLAAWGAAGGVTTYVPAPNVHSLVPPIGKTELPLSINPEVIKALTEGRAFEIPAHSKQSIGEYHGFPLEISTGAAPFALQPGMALHIPPYRDPSGNWVSTDENLTPEQKMLLKPTTNLGRFLQAQLGIDVHTNALNQKVYFTNPIFREGDAAFKDVTKFGGMPWENPYIEGPGGMIIRGDWITGEPKGMATLFEGGFAALPRSTQAEMVEEVYGNELSTWITNQQGNLSFQSMIGEAGRITGQPNLTNYEFFHNMLTTLAANPENLARFGVGQFRAEVQTQRVQEQTKLMRERLAEKAGTQDYLRYEQIPGTEGMYQEYRTGDFFAMPVGQRRIFENMGAGRLNYEALESLNTFYPEAAEMIGARTGPGEQLAEQSAATEAWRSMYAVQAFNQSALEGRPLAMPAAQGITSQQARSMLARWPQNFRQMTPEQQYKELSAMEIEPGTTLKDVGALRFAGGFHLPNPETAYGIEHVDITGQTIAHRMDVYGRTLMNTLQAQGISGSAQAVERAVTGKRSFGEYMGRILGEGSGGDVQKRISGYEAPGVIGGRYLENPALAPNEMFVPRERFEEAERQLLANDQTRDIYLANRKKFEEQGWVPMLTQRFPQLDPETGMVAVRGLVPGLTPQERINELYAANPNAPNVVQYSSFLTRGFVGDIDFDPQLSLMLPGMPDGELKRQLMMNPAEAAEFHEGRFQQLFPTDDLQRKYDIAFTSMEELKPGEGPLKKHLLGGPVRQPMYDPNNPELYAAGEADRNRVARLSRGTAYNVARGMRSAIATLPNVSEGDLERALKGNSPFYQAALDSELKALSYLEKARSSARFGAKELDDGGYRYSLYAYPTEGGSSLTLWQQDPGDAVGLGTRRPWNWEAIGMLAAESPNITDEYLALNLTTPERRLEAMASMQGLVGAERGIHLAQRGFITEESPLVTDLVSMAAMRTKGDIEGIENMPLQFRGQLTHGLEGARQKNRAIQAHSTMYQWLTRSGTPSAIDIAQSAAYFKEIDNRTFASLAFQGMAESMGALEALGFSSGQDLVYDLMGGEAPSRTEQQAAQSESFINMVMRLKGQPEGSPFNRGLGGRGSGRRGSTPSGTTPTGGGTGGTGGGAAAAAAASDDDDGPLPVHLQSMHPEILELYKDLQKNIGLIEQHLDPDNRKAGRGRTTIGQARARVMAGVLAAGRAQQSTLYEDIAGVLGEAGFPIDLSDRPTTWTDAKGHVFHGTDPADPLDQQIFEALRADPSRTEELWNTLEPYRSKLRGYGAISQSVDRAVQVQRQANVYFPGLSETLQAAQEPLDPLGRRISSLAGLSDVQRMFRPDRPIGTMRGGPRSVSAQQMMEAFVQDPGFQNIHEEVLRISGMAQGGMIPPEMQREMLQNLFTDDENLPYVGQIMQATRIARENKTPLPALEETSLAMKSVGVDTDPKVLAATSWLAVGGEKLEKFNEQMKIFSERTEEAKQKLSDFESDRTNIQKRNAADRAVLEQRLAGARVGVAAIDMEAEQFLYRDDVDAQLAKQRLGDQRVRGMQQIIGLEESLGEDRGRSDFTDSLRRIFGGFGLFYMSRLMGMGMGQLSRGYAEREEDTAAAFGAVGETMGIGVGAYASPEVSYQRSLIRAGGIPYAGIRAIGAEVAAGPLGDFGGAAMTGVGAALLAAHIAPVATAAAGTGIAGSLGLSGVLGAIGTGLAGPAALTLGGIAGAATLGAVQIGYGAFPEQTGISAAQNMLIAEEGQQAPMFSAESLRGFYSYLTGRWKLGTSVEANIAANKYGGLADQFFAGGSPNISAQDLPGYLQVISQSNRFKDFLPSELYGPGAMLEQAGLLTQDNLERLSLAGRYGQLAPLAQLGGSMMQLRGQTPLPSAVTSFVADSLMIGRSPEDVARLQGGVDILSQYPNLPLMDLSDKFIEGIAEYGTGQLGSIYGGQLSNYTVQVQLGLAPAGQQPSAPMIGGLPYRPRQPLTPERGLRQLVEDARTSSILTGGLEMMMTSMSWGADYDIAQDLGAGYTQMDKQQRFLVDRMMAGSPYAYAQNVMNISRTDPFLANRLSEQVTTDINMQGEVTGHQLFTTSLFQGAITPAETAAGMWGPDWAAGGSPIRNAMVNGYQAPWGAQLYGFRAANQYMADLSYEAQMASAGIAARGAQLSWAFNTGVGIDAYNTINPQTGQPFNFNTGPASWNVQGVGSYTSQGGGLWGYQDALRYLGYAQTEFGFGMQQQQMNLGFQQQQQQWGMQAQFMQLGVNQTFAQWGFQDQMRELQWGWKQEDFAENIRFMSGRDRRLAERQMERETIMYGVEGEQIDTMREFEKERMRLEEQRFNMEKEHYMERRALEIEAFEKQKDFYEERKRLEEEQMKVQRAFQTEQLQLQKDAAGVQAHYAKMMKEARDDLEAARQYQEDIMAKQKVRQDTELEFYQNLLIIIGTMAGIDLSNLIANESIFPAEDSGVGSGDPGGGANQPPNPNPGGPPPPGPPPPGMPTGGMGKQPTGWGTVVVTPSGNPASPSAGSTPIVLNIQIGNETLNRYVLRTSRDSLEI